jgi:hypothetical protein
VAALHRALHAALREGWSQCQVTQMALEQASSIAAPRAAAAAAAATVAAAAAAAVAAGLSEETECVICFTAARDCVLVPCGHAHTCMQCGGALASCPMCRSAVERAIRLYADGSAPR